jgi:hypothetical protein
MLTLAELDAALKDYLIEDYNRQPHSATGIAPHDRWNGKGFLPRMPESLEQLDLLLLTVVKPRRVQQDGVRFQCFRYIDPVLAAYVGESVTIRYDPGTSPRSGSTTGIPFSAAPSARSSPARPSVCGRSSGRDTRIIKAKFALLMLFVDVCRALGGALRMETDASSSSSDCSVQNLLGSRQPRISSENAAAFCLDPQIFGRGGGFELETAFPLSGRKGERLYGNLYHHPGV